ncbi:DUF4381 domain-containing protein [Thalassotalea euphylliae]|uniref:DUF4381 domain-containing protein n=1 Tax=Thalassotalea euphylliae TaxID=1655234 RepID=UPI003642AE91
MTRSQVNDALTPKNGNPLLEGFDEISRPADISWWPETLGWQILFFFLLLLILHRVYLLFKHYMDNAYRRWADEQLKQLNQSTDDIQKLPVLLKKTAIYAYARENVADLTGKQWEAWLDKECASTTFSQAPLSGLLSHLSYSQSPDVSAEQFEQLKQQTSIWIKHHKGAR